MFPQILLIIILGMVLIIPFEHIFLKKNGKDLDSFTNMVFFEPIEKKGSDLFSFLKNKGIIIYR